MGREAGGDTGAFGAVELDGGGPRFDNAWSGACSVGGFEAGEVRDWGLADCAVFPEGAVLSGVARSGAGSWRIPRSSGAVP